MLNIPERMLRVYFKLSLVIGLVLGFLFTMKSLFIFSILVLAVSAIACLRKDASGGFAPSSRAVAFYFIAFYILLPFFVGSWMISLAVYFEILPAVSVFHSSTHSIFR